MAKATEVLRERICGLSDDQLLRIIYVDCDQYREEALDYARAELNKRKLSLVPLVVRDINQDINTKEEISWQALGFILAIIYLACALIMWVVMYKTPREESSRAVLILAGLVFTFFYRHYAAFRRRKRFLEAYEVLGDRPDESPILYLRSFCDDSQAARLIGKTTESEQLAMIFDEIGPFIAIGAPDEELPELGAALMYVSNEQWQQRVIELIAEAQLVILRIGVSPGLLWEVKTALDGIEPERLILLVPRDKKLYEDFRENTKEMFQYALPEYAMNKEGLRKIERVLRLMQFPWSLVGFSRTITLQGIIYFEPDSTPHLVEIGIDLFRGSIEAPEVPKILRALQPVFNQLGIDWSMPRVRLSNIFSVCSYLLLMIISMLIFYMRF